MALLWSTLVGLSGCQETAMPSGADGSTGDFSMSPDVAMGQLPPGLADVSGTHLLSASLIVDPSKLLVFRAVVMLTPRDSTSATLRLTLQPLSAFPENKPDRKPVGAALSAEGVATAAATFSIDFGSVLIGGGANPLNGMDIEAMLKLTGSLRSKDRMCGAVEGSVSKPILVRDLMGSAWGAFRVAPELMGEALPPADPSCG